MNLVKSITNPELLVSEKGDVFNSKTGNRISLTMNHCYGRGYVVAYWHEGKQKRLSVAKLVVETHIKKAPLEKNEYIEFIDDNESNVHKDNLRIFTLEKSNRGRKTKRKESEETYSTWMNGHEELYC